MKRMRMFSKAMPPCFFYRRYGRIVICILGIIAVSAPALSQQDDIEFETLSLEHGLSQNSVLSIVQDKDGFMWFASQDGLNKYDGYEFTIFRHDPEDTNSLSHTWILSLFIDSSGMLWIGTFNEGLNKYDIERDEFTHYKLDPDDPNTLSNNIVRSICEDRTGTLWIGTDEGLNRLDRETDSFERYLNDPDDSGSISHNSIRAIHEDGSGNIWIGTEGGGLNRLVLEEGKFIRYQAEPGNPASLSNDFVRSIYADKSGDLWVGTFGGGLNRFDRSSGDFHTYRHAPDDPHSISHDEINTIFEDRSGNLWIGTDGGGLNLLDRKNGRFTRYRNDPSDPKSLCYDEVHSVFEDRSGILWIGTYGGGISKYDLHRKKFHLYKHDPDNPNSLSADVIWTIHEDEAGILWIGTQGGGLNRYDRKNNIFKHYLHDPDDPNSLSNDIVRMIFVDRAGVFWIGTYGGGLNRFDRESGKFRSYQHDPDDPNSLSHQYIRWIYEDSSGEMWVCTNGGGLNRFDRSTGRFKRYRSDIDDPYSLSSDFARVIIEDSEGILWVGTQGAGIDLFDRDTGRFINMREDHDDPYSLSSNHILCIFRDTSENMWVGTWGGGLNMFDRKTGGFILYDVDDGLPSNAVYGILEDDHGNLWLSTNNGLSKFNPAQKTFKNYNTRDGIQSKEFNGNAFHKTENGEMFFGGIRGLNSFYPDDIVDNPHIPPILITAFSKLNKKITFEKPISEIDEIVLSYRDYVFSFEFAALSYEAPEKNMYAYKMVGLDKDWIYTDSSKRFANYTTLPFGKYIFKVKGSNNDGIWNEEGASVNITITPPFWATWWFRLSAFLFILVLAVLSYRYSLRNERMKIELQAAHDAQMSIMPPSDPDVPAFEISGTCIPATEVGGDFYDYLWLNEEKTEFGIVVADVSGKAMKAAMIAVMSSGMVVSKAEELSSIKDIMTHLNRSLYLKTDELMYTTMCLASLDTETRKFTFSLAGFNEPLLKRNISVSRLQTSGNVFPLGAFRDSTYQEKIINIEYGDVIVIYTDGISEARDNNNGFYGTEKLEYLLKRMDISELSAREINNRIIEDVKNYCRGAQHLDDMTVVVIKCKSDLV